MRTILVMPEYNEEKTVIPVLTKAEPYFDIMVVVNDGSIDASALLIRNWMQDHEKVYLLSLPGNRGMSGALLAGFHWLNLLLQRGVISPDDIVVTIDADGQHAPEEVPAAAKYFVEKHLDVLLMKRDLERYPLYKRIGNLLLTGFASVLSGVRYRDVECGFRFLGVGILPKLLEYYTGKRYGCAQEIGIITGRLGLKIENLYPCTIPYYRPGARFKDGFTNAVMGLMAFVRVVLGVRSDILINSCKVLSGVKIDGVRNRGCPF